MEVMKKETLDLIVEDMYQGVLKRCQKNNDTMTLIQFAYYELEHKKLIQDFLKKFITVEQKVKE